jgi:uncharacterized phage protein (TIGR01671 family)
MRQHIFRGQTKGKEWVHGDLITVTGLQDNSSWMIKSLNPEGTICYDYVSPESVGEYLADDILDNHNTLICEGDIVIFKKTGADKSDSIRGVVKYDNARFIVDQITEGSYSFNDDTLGCEYFLEFYTEDGPEFGWYELQVIGNSIDNPELLEIGEL